MGAEKGLTDEHRQTFAKTRKDTDRYDDMRREIIAKRKQGKGQRSIEDWNTRR